MELEPIGEYSFPVQEAEEPRCYMDEVPRDILKMIFNCCERPEQLSLRSTCRKWKDITDEIAPITWPDRISGLNARYQKLKQRPIYRAPSALPYHSGIRRPILFSLEVLLGLSVLAPAIISLYIATSEELLSLMFTYARNQKNLIPPNLSFSSFKESYAGALMNCSSSTLRVCTTLLDGNHSNKALVGSLSGIYSFMVTTLINYIGSDSIFSQPQILHPQDWGVAEKLRRRYKILLNSEISRELKRGVPETIARLDKLTGRIRGKNLWKRVTIVASVFFLNIGISIGSLLAFRWGISPEVIYENNFEHFITPVQYCNTSSAELALLNPSDSIGTYPGCHTHVFERSFHTHVVETSNSQSSASSIAAQVIVTALPLINGFGELILVGVRSLRSYVRWHLQ